MISRDAQIVLHIKRYCLDTREAVMKCSNDYEQFLADTVCRHAISMCLLQIGELSGRLTDTFRDKNKDRVAWGKMRGMRNFFAHEYHKVKLPMVWKTAADDIPSLLAFCDELIASHPEDFAFPEIPEEDIL